MPAKKTTTKKTTKKTTTKKPTAKKTVTKRTTTKKATNPVATVIVKKQPTNHKTNTSCCTTSNCGKFAPHIIVILLLINTFLLVFMFLKKPVEIEQTVETAFYNALEKFEATKVGGEENYNVIKEIYNLEAYQQDQKRRLDTTLNTLKQIQKDGTTLPQ